MLNFLNLDNTGKGYLKGWELLKQRLNKAESKTVPNVPFYCVSLIHISAKKQTKKVTIHVYLKCEIRIHKHIKVLRSITNKSIPVGFLPYHSLSLSINPHQHCQVLLGDLGQVN